MLWVRFLIMARKNRYNFIRVNTYWHIEQRTLKTLYLLTYLKLTRFCDYILLNLKFSGEWFVDLFLSTFSFGYCIVYPFSNYTVWLSLWYLQTFLIIYFFFINIQINTTLIVSKSITIYLIRCSRDRIPVGLTVYYAISVYHDWCCEFDFWWWREKFDTTLCNTVCEWFPPPINLTVTI
jgi:hypothetical protein